MEVRNKKPGSARLKEVHYRQMEELGITNESAYLQHLLEKNQSKLEVVKEQQYKMLPATQDTVAHNTIVKDQLTIQRLSLENRKLQEKLEQLSKSTQETLNGVHHKVHSLLQEELQKRDFESLKKSHAQCEQHIKQLEKELQNAKERTQQKQKEIEALVKKLGFVELGKTLLPGAISGLAKQYPKQMKGIAGTLGRLGFPHSFNEADQEKDHLLQIIEYLQEVFTEQQFEQALQLMVQLGEQIKQDDGLIKKISYYMEQLQQNSKQAHKESEEQTPD